MKLLAHLRIVKEWPVSGEVGANIGFAKGKMGNQLRGRVTCVVPFMLRELNVVEQRYRAVLEVLSGSGIAGAGSRAGTGPLRPAADYDPAGPGPP